MVSRHVSAISASSWPQSSTKWPGRLFAACADGVGAFVCGWRSFTQGLEGVVNLFIQSGERPVDAVGVVVRVPVNVGKPDDRGPQPFVPGCLIVLRCTAAPWKTMSAVAASVHTRPALVRFSPSAYTFFTAHWAAAGRYRYRHGLYAATLGFILPSRSGQ